ncbi:MAG: hypothetical protein QOG16_830, partial [Actinomycetota bacterium]|nr:hypothetical protein [Actinomycetota bacterium]
FPSLGVPQVYPKEGAAPRGFGVRSI